MNYVVYFWYSCRLIRRTLRRSVMRTLLEWQFCCWHAPIWDRNSLEWATMWTMTTMMSSFERSHPRECWLIGSRGTSWQTSRGLPSSPLTSILKQTRTVENLLHHLITPLQNKRHRMPLTRLEALYASQSLNVSQKERNSAAVMYEDKSDTRFRMLLMLTTSFD